MSTDILVVDDETDLLELLSLNLSAEGYTVRTAETAAEALSAIETSRPDLILLDIMLGDISGIQLTGRLKNTPATADIPIILLTAKDTETDMIVGLSMGADDYITKPFSSQVLVARIRAVLRRAYPEPGIGRSFFSVGPVKVIPDSRQVLVDNASIDLTAAEYGILLELVQAEGCILSREELKSRLGPIGQGDNERIIDVHMATLRKKLGLARKIIKTVHGIGYRIAI